MLFYQLAQPEYSHLNLYVSQVYNGEEILYPLKNFSFVDAKGIFNLLPINLTSRQLHPCIVHEECDEVLIPKLYDVSRSLNYCTCMIEHKTINMSNINKSTQGDQLQLNNLENYSNLVSNETMRTQESSKVQTCEESCLKNKDSNVYTSEQQEHNTTCKEIRQKRSRKSREIFCTVPGCNKVFKKKWNFSLHIKTHFKIRQIECEICGKRFTQKSNFNKHMHIHRNSQLKDRKRFECHICFRKYTQNYNLKVGLSHVFSLFEAIYLEPFVHPLMKLEKNIDCQENLM